MDRDAKGRSLEQFSATHGHPPIILNGWHGESAIDLSCTSEGSPGGTSPFPVSASTPKIGAISSLQGALGMDLSGILQAGLIHPVTGQIVNGSLRRDDAAMRRRRGRRKHAEGGMDLILLKEQTLQTGILVGVQDSGRVLTSKHFTALVFWSYVSLVLFFLSYIGLLRCPLICSTPIIWGLER